MAVRDWLDGMGWGEVISLGLLLNEDLFSGQLIPVAVCVSRYSSCWLCSGPIHIIKLCIFNDQLIGDDCIGPQSQSTSACDTFH